MLLSTVASHVTLAVNKLTIFLVYLVKLTKYALILWEIQPSSMISDLHKNWLKLVKMTCEIRKTFFLQQVFSSLCQHFFSWFNFFLNSNPVITLSFSWTTLYAPQYGLDGNQKDDFYDGLLNVVRQWKFNYSSRLNGQIGSNPEDYVWRLVILKLWFFSDVQLWTWQ